MYKAPMPPLARCTKKTYGEYPRVNPEREYLGTAL